MLRLRAWDFVVSGFRVSRVVSIFFSIIVLLPQYYRILSLYYRIFPLISRFRGVIVNLGPNRFCTLRA